MLYRYRFHACYVYVQCVSQYIYMYIHTWKSTIFNINSCSGKVSFETFLILTTPGWLSSLRVSPARALRNWVLPAMGTLEYLFGEQTWPWKNLFDEHNFYIQIVHCQVDDCNFVKYRSCLRFTVTAGEQRNSGEHQPLWSNNAKTKCGAFQLLILEHAMWAWQRPSRIIRGNPIRFQRNKGRKLPPKVSNGIQMNVDPLIHGSMAFKFPTWMCGPVSK